jgi:hypothetical protein
MLTARYKLKSLPATLSHFVVCPRGSGSKLFGGRSKSKARSSRLAAEW